MAWASYVSLVMCLALLAARYKLSSPASRRLSPHRWHKTARTLVSAALAFAAIMYTLRLQISEIDGTKHEPSWIERIVMSLAR